MRLDMGLNKKIQVLHVLKVFPFVVFVLLFASVHMYLGWH